MRRESNCSHNKKNNKSWWDVDYNIFFKKRVPITEWLPCYNLSFFFQDLLAGFTVSLTEIPQAIAYAGIAGVSAEYGLYSCIMGGIIYAIFGSCKDINIGPTSIMSLMIQPYVEKFGPNVAVLISFQCGLIIFLLGLLKLGFVIEYFSFPIVAGFTCAASIETASLQLNNLFGIKSSGTSFLEAWNGFIHNSDKIKKWDTVLGLTSFIFLVFLREIKRFGTLRYREDWSKNRNIVGIIVFILSIARNAIIIVIGIGIGYSLGKDAPFQLAGEVKGGFPSFEMPPFTSTKNGVTYSFTQITSGLGASIIFIPLIAILGSISIAKTFANGRRVDATQEILTLGISNTLSSFFGSMPIAGGFTRTALNNASGVQTTFGGVFTSVITILAIAFLTPTFYYVPKATMASVILCAMVYLFEYQAFVILWKNKKQDLIPFLTTIISCLAISLEYGILIGIIVNLLFLLYPAARPKIVITTAKVPKYHGDVILVKPVDNLFFPAAENLRDRVLKCQGNDLIVVIDGKYVRNIDITLARSMVVLTREMMNRGHKVIFWRFKKAVINVCIGLDKSFGSYFRDGKLENITQDRSFAGV